MTYIPDCRTDKNYNEKYLNNADKEFVKGFDWCIEEAVDLFFDNLDVVESDYLESVLNTEYPFAPTHYVQEFRYRNTEKEEREIKTYADLLRFEILRWVECERDELITSMIDNMDEAEYQKIKKAVDDGNT